MPLNSTNQPNSFAIIPVCRSRLLDSSQWRSILTFCLPTPNLYFVLVYFSLLVSPAVVNSHQLQVADLMVKHLFQTLLSFLRRLPRHS